MGNQFNKETQAFFAEEERNKAEQDTTPTILAQELKKVSVSEVTSVVYNGEDTFREEAFPYEEGSITWVSPSGRTFYLRWESN